MERSAAEDHLSIGLILFPGRALLFLKAFHIQEMVASGHGPVVIFKLLSVPFNRFLPRHNNALLQLQCNYTSDPLAYAKRYRPFDPGRVILGIHNVH